MIRCVAFDFDGTLVQSNAIKRQAFFQTVRLLGEDLDDVVEDVLRHVPGDRYILLREMAARADARRPLPPSGTAWPERLADAYTKICDDEIARCPEVPGAMEALETLRRRGCALFINSSTPSAPLVAVVNRRNMGGSFRGVWGNDAGKVENLQRALALTNARVDEMVFVGDAEADRAAAATLGCRFVGVANEFNDFKERPEPLVADLTGLAAYVESLG
jgi:phosphoglycolate phosphatase-like HAD superfamily hydrolase